MVSMGCKDVSSGQFAFQDQALDGPEGHRFAQGAGGGMAAKAISAQSQVRQDGLDHPGIRQVKWAEGIENHHPPQILSGMAGQIPQDRIKPKSLRPKARIKRDNCGRDGDLR